MSDDDWTCGKPGCDLGVDGHDFGLAIAHTMDMDEQSAYDAADRILDRAERDLLGEECSNCRVRYPADDMRECANSIPGHGRGPFHCWDCVAGGCCGSCTDEDRRHEAQERGRR